MRATTLILFIFVGFASCKPKPQHLYNEPASPYEFGYKIADEYGNRQHRQESGDAEGNKKGSYGYSDAYGLYRNVEYTADGYGFRAYINSNEPGVGAESPADAKIDKDPTAGKVHRSQPVKPSTSYKAVHQLPKPVHKIVPVHPKPVRRNRPLIHADPSYTLTAVARKPDVLPGFLPDNVLLQKAIAHPQSLHKAPPSRKIVHETVAFKPAALVHDRLTVGYKDPRDLYKLPPQPQRRGHPLPPVVAHAPKPTPPGPHQQKPGTTLKTFTEKPATKPEYRPKFASKANYKR